MMAQEKDGGAAFPIPDQRDTVTGEGLVQGERGLTIRDWFAGQALAGMAGHWVETPRPVDCDDYAKRAYRFADAMLKARAQQGE
jgi:hypothetical protein